jgi:MFS family permease
MKKYLRRWNEADINLRYFLIGVLFLGINAGIIQPTFNNYLSDIFNMKEVARGYLEFPRELPGFFLIIVTSVLSAYSIRLWAIMVGFMSGLGVIGLGFLSPTLSMMMIWMVLWNMGDHLFMPVESTMGLYLAKDGKQGKRLGQIAGARNLAMIFGAIAVYIFASYYSKGALYSKLYLLAGACAILSVISFSRVKVHADKKGENRRFVIRKEYSWFYALNVLFGAQTAVPYLCALGSYHRVRNRSGENGDTHADLLNCRCTVQTGIRYRGGPFR